jgi:membrane protein
VIDDCSKTAASLAYSTLLAIVPLMLVSLTLASKVPTFSHAANDIQQFILTNFVTGAAGSIVQYLNDFMSQVTRLSWTNMIAFTVTGLLLLYNMVMAFNGVWRVQMTWHWHFTLRFLFYFSILLLAPLMLAVLLLIVSYVASWSLFANHYFHNIDMTPLIIVLPYLAAFITFSFFNWVLPTCQVKLRYAMASGFLAMIFFELTKYLFTWYISVFPTYRLIYGALASIPIFFIWIYLSWVIILMSAIFCKGLQIGFKTLSPAQ